MISKIKFKYQRTTHKYGVKLPHSVEEAPLIDKDKGDDHWYEAIEKEMKNVKVGFREFEKCKDASELQSDPK